MPSILDQKSRGRQDVLLSGRILLEMDDHQVGKEQGDLVGVTAHRPRQHDSMPMWRARFDTVQLNLTSL